MKRAFKVKQKVFFIIFKGFSVAKKLFQTREYTLILQIKSQLNSIFITYLKPILPRRYMEKIKIKDWKAVNTAGCRENQFEIGYSK